MFGDPASSTPPLTRIEVVLIDGLATWMMFSVQLLQPLARDVRVDLRGGNVRVPEQQLHHPQIGTVVDEMRREGVPQRMR